MPLLFLNEKSCGTDCDPLRADRAMTDLLRTALAVARAAGARSDDARTALVSEVPLKEVRIAEGYPVGKWLADPKNRDLWQRLRVMQGKAPFKAVLPDGRDPLDVEYLEYRHDGTAVRGLGHAHMMDGLGLSLPVHACWDAPALSLERERSVELADGTEDVETSRVDVRHASAERHLDVHLPWIRASLDTAAHTGAQLWEKRTVICPSLQFLTGVEDDLRCLAPDSIAVVRRRLIELQESVTRWDPDTQPFPQWRGDVRREFESRRRLCWFPDWDGESRLFQWHTDFPPRPGRLHFRLVHESATLRIAHIGRKLGV